MRKILILTAGYGEGHNSAARSAREAFSAHEDVDAEIVDVFALYAPRLNDVSRACYRRLINDAPRVWSGFYQWLDRSPRAPALIRGLKGRRRLLADIIAAKKPEALVSTYPVYGWMLADLARERGINVPLYTVVTDALTINSLWYRVPSKHWFVTDPDSAAFMSEHGVPANRVTASGFPVAAHFAARPSHWEPSDLRMSRPRILFMVNSGRGPARRVARALLAQPDWHITITTGRDEGLNRELVELAGRSPASSEIIGWTDRIPELLMTHHVVVGKAGGASTQESINALCPMLVSQIVPGQEEGNYELLRRNRAGALAGDPDRLIKRLRDAFNDDAMIWRDWRSNLRTLARPRAAQHIASHVLADTAKSRINAPAPGISAAPLAR